MNPARENRNAKAKGIGPAVRPNLRLVNSVSWNDIAPRLVYELVKLVAGHGSAIMFGRTSDGGALSICVLDNQNKIKEYPRDEADVDAIFVWLRDVYYGPEPQAS